MVRNPCHILNVDPSLLSGAALFDRGNLRWWETHIDVSESANTDAIVRRALREALDNDQTLVVAIELNYAGNRRVQDIEGLGAAVKQFQWSVDRMWRQEQVARGITRPAPKKTRIRLSDWRKHVYGTSRISSDQAKRRAVATVNSIYSLNLKLKDHDAAEAIMMGRYATFAEEIAALLPKRAFKRGNHGQHATG